jgi:hypothetical protein
MAAWLLRADWGEITWAVPREELERDPRLRPAEVGVEVEQECSSFAFADPASGIARKRRARWLARGLLLAGIDAHLVELVIPDRRVSAGRGALRAVWQPRCTPVEPATRRMRGGEIR